MINSMRKLLVMAALVSAIPVTALAQEHRAVAQSDAWKALQTLVGQWQGTAMEDGKQQVSQVKVRMTGGGSALMHVMAEGTPYEMVTMFHPDLDELLATHYCAAHNQPRMKLISSTPTHLVFEFKDGTNIGPKDGHMVGLVIDILDRDHHDEAWSYLDGGKRSTTVFHYARTDAVAKTP